MKGKRKIFYLVLFFNTFLILFQHCSNIKRNSVVENSKSANRIGIAAVGDSAGSEICKVAGRAPYYLIFGENGIFLKSVTNSSQSQERWTSSKVVEILINESVKTVVAGKFGDKMTRQLETNEIEYHEYAGKAQEIVQTIRKNKRSNRDAQY